MEKRIVEPHGFKVKRLKAKVVHGGGGECGEEWGSDPKRF